MVSGDVDANIGKMMAAFAFWRFAKREIGNLQTIVGFLRRSNLFLFIDRDNRSKKAYASGKNILCRKGTKFYSFGIKVT